MKPFKILFFFLLSLPIFSIAQQNFFNIPSGDITRKGKGFYQHQFNLYSNKMESKSHFVYGLNKGWDVGINLVGKGFYFAPEWRILHNDQPEKGALYPILMGTVQKQFHLSPSFDVNLGTQLGYNLSGRISNKEINYFNYALGVYHFNHHHSRIVAGLYQTTPMYVGQGNRTGMMLGYEFQLNERWVLMGDWVSGSNDASVAVLGGMWNASPHLQLCAGWQIPNPQTPKPMGLVLELNWMGWEILERDEKTRLD